MTKGEWIAGMAVLSLMTLWGFWMAWRREKFTGDLARSVDELLDVEKSPARHPTRLATPEDVEDIEQYSKTHGGRGDT